MDNDTHGRPQTAQSVDAPMEVDLGGLLEQVEKDHGHEGASAMSDHLRNRMAETTETLDTAAGFED